MIKKVIFLVEAPFNLRDFKRFGIETLMQAGFDVWVWDFTPFLHPALNRLGSPPDPIEFDKLVQFTGKKEAFEAITELAKDVFIISILHYRYSTIRIFRAITKKNIPYSVLGPFLSVYECQAGRKNNVLTKLLRITPTKLAQHLEMLPARLPASFFGIRPAKFVFAGGEKSRVAVPLAGPESRIVYIHSFDYDLYLSEEQHDHSDRKFIVFLDQNLPFNTDPLVSRVKRLTTAEEYYPSLCRFFDHVEAMTGIKVVIAAHPRAHYEDNPDLFQGREVRRGSTAGLIKNSMFVITHYTTAINLAILYKKPILFITTNDIEKSFRQVVIDALANYFGQRVINVNRGDNIDLKRDVEVRNDIYDAYKNDFIKKPGTPEAPFWNVVGGCIGSLK